MNDYNLDTSATERFHYNCDSFDKFRFVVFQYEFQFPPLKVFKGGLDDVVIFCSREVDDNHLDHIHLGDQKPGALSCLFSGLGINTGHEVRPAGNFDIDAEL